MGGGWQKVGDARLIPRWSRIRGRAVLTSAMADAHATQRTAMIPGPDVSLSLAAYLPQDRLRALAGGEPLPRRATGSALLADLSGFTELTETLTRARGARRGIEELTREINALYGALIAEVERFGGSVIDFAGDAITCWFDGDDRERDHEQTLGATPAAPTSPPAPRFAPSPPLSPCNRRCSSSPESRSRSR